MLNSEFNIPAKPLYTFYKLSDFFLNCTKIIMILESRNKIVKCTIQRTWYIYKMFLQVFEHFFQPLCT